MKRITMIEIQKNNPNRVSIYLNNTFAFGLDMTIYLNHGLSKGMELDDGFIEQILKAEEKIKAFNFAIALLSSKDRTEKEIINKLTDKGYENDIITDVLDKLREYNYINDELYSEKYINDKIKFSKYGKNKIRMILCTKGVNKEIISQKISQIDNETEYKRAYNIAQKKLTSLEKYDYLKKKSKLGNFLISKGFDFDVVNKVLRNLIKK